MLIKLRYILEVWIPRINSHSGDYDPDEYFGNKKVLSLHSYNGASYFSQLSFGNNTQKELNLKTKKYKSPTIPPRSDNLENNFKLTFRSKQHYPYSPWEIMDRFSYLKK